MIQLSDGFTTVRTCKVQGGSGPWAYFIGFTNSDGLPEVGIEGQIRLSDGRLAGFHFKLSDGSDWLVVRGSASKPSPAQMAEIEEKLGLKRKEPELEED